MGEAIGLYERVVAARTGTASGAASGSGSILDVTGACGRRRQSRKLAAPHPMHL